MYREEERVNQFVPRQMAAPYTHTDKLCITSLVKETLVDNIYKYKAQQAFPRHISYILMGLHAMRNYKVKVERGQQRNEHRRRL